MAMSAGITDGLKLAGKIKDHLVQAVRCKRPAKSSTGVGLLA
jgi:hypothetical protein